jgi:hypothetical protein
MAADNAARHVGVRGDLFALEDLRPLVPAAVGADGSIPLVALNCAPLLTRVSSSAEYREAAAHAVWAWLPDFEGRLVAAGGSVSRLLCRQQLGTSDIDLFPVGISQGEVRGEIRKLGAHLAARCAADDILHVYRTRYCVSYVVAGTGEVDKKQEGVPDNAKYVRATIQVILRIYSTISEVLHGFDLGSCAVADDGQRLYFTSASRLAFERGLNVLDLSRRRASYEPRAVKYLNRGFAFALPELACDRVPHDLPYLRLRGRFDLKTATVRATVVEASRPGGSPWSRDIRDKGGWSPAVARDRNPAARTVKPQRAPRPAEPLYEPMLYDGAPVGFADLLHNLHSLRMGRPEALRVHILYSGHVDICDLQPLEALHIFGEQLDTSLKRHSAQEFQEVWDLLCPKDEDSASYFRSQRAHFEAEQFVAIFRARLAALAPQLEVPLKIETAGDKTIALSSTDAKISPEAWYGPHLARDQINIRDVSRRTSADHVVAVLELFILRPLAALIVVPYLGKVIAETCSACWRTGIAENSADHIADCLNCGIELIAYDRSNILGLPKYVLAALNTPFPAPDQEGPPQRSPLHRRDQSRGRTLPERSRSQDPIKPEPAYTGRRLLCRELQ